MKKPLVTGALTEREAVRFAYGASLAGLAACLLAALVAGGTAVTAWWDRQPARAETRMPPDEESR